MLTQPTGITATHSLMLTSAARGRTTATASAAANLFGTAGVLTGVGSETLTLSGTGTLSSKNVNVAQSFASLSGFTLTGNGSTLASNYTLTGGTDFLDITPAILTVSGTTAREPGVQRYHHCLIERGNPGRCVRQRCRDAR